MGYFRTAAADCLQRLTRRKSATASTPSNKGTARKPTARATARADDGRQNCNATIRVVHSFCEGVAGRSCADVLPRVASDDTGPVVFVAIRAAQGFSTPGSRRRCLRRLVQATRFIPLRLPSWADWIIGRAESRGPWRFGR